MIYFIILFWLLLIDSIGAVVLTWFGASWYVHHFRTLSRLFPPAKGWAAWYFILVLLFGAYLQYTGNLW